MGHTKRGHPKYKIGDIIEEWWLPHHRYDSTMRTTFYLIVGIEYYPAGYAKYKYVLKDLKDESIWATRWTRIDMIDRGIFDHKSCNMGYRRVG